jgi:hypothetical protein
MQLEALPLSVLRPSRKESMRLAARELARKVNEWLVSDDKMDEDELDDLVDFLADEISYGVTDGHLLAKRVDEEFDIEGDTDLVDILSGAQREIEFYHATAVEKWVRTTYRKAKLRVSREVALPDRFPYNGRRGTIVRIDSKKYQYYVTMSSAETLAVNCEDVEALN